ISPQRLRKNLTASLRRKSPRIGSLRAALSPSAFVRVLPFNPKKEGPMSASQAIKHARAVRQRLRHPRNAVADHGIDLKRKPVLTVIEPAPPAPDIAALPLGIGTPLPADVLS